jgi:hypothetical protein
MFTQPRVLYLTKDLLSDVQASMPESQRLNFTGSHKFPHTPLGAGAALNITSCSLAIQVNGHTNLKGNIQKPVS